jgi:hypothetical protein
MLRYLGIPSRVAVGFTSGTWKNGVWTVTDRDAHAWVEAWFAGYGWLTFDPTPGRGTLSATYTNASDSADAVRALGTGRYLTQPEPTRTTRRRAQPADTSSGDGGRPVWPFVPAFVAAALLLLVVPVVKAVRRRRRASIADPRGRASAARAELVEFVRDQGSDLDPAARVDEVALELRRLGVGCDGFARAFDRARYGPPATAERAADELRRELHRVLGNLRGRLGPGRRARGFFRLRSLRSG